MKTILLFLLFVSMFLILSCEADTPPYDPPPPPIFEIVSAPELMLGNVDSLYEFRIRAQNLDPQPDSTRCIVYLDANGTGPSVLADDIYLYDDGNAQTFSGPPYASPTSTDIVPNDGIYTRRINSRQLFVETEGDYLFTFHAEGIVDSLSTIAEVANIDGISFSQLPIPQSFGECFEPEQLEVHVERDPQDRIDSVTAFFYHEDSVTETVHFLPIEGDTVWQFSLSPRSFPCIQTNSGYELDITAYSQFGRMETEYLPGYSFVNSPSILTNSTLPDTIFRPVAVGDTDTVIVTVDLNDCELTGNAANFVVMRFDVSLGDTFHFPPTPLDDFYLRDDGILPDTTYGDDVYTVGLAFWRNDSIVDSMYYFRFYTDCPATERSDYLYDSVRVIQPPAIGGPIPPNANDIGIGVVR